MIKNDWNATVEWKKKIEEMVTRSFEQRNAA